MINKSFIPFAVAATLFTTAHAATSTKTFSAPLIYDTTGDIAIELTLTQTGAENLIWSTNEYRYIGGGNVPTQGISLYFYTNQASEILDLQIEGKMRIFNTKTGETLPESALMTDAYSWNVNANGSFGAIPQGQLRFSNPATKTTFSSKNERSCELNERCVQLPSQLSGTASFTAIPGHYLDISQIPGCADFSCMEKKTDYLTAVYGGVSFMIGAPIPEPSIITLTFSGAIAASAILARRRKPKSKIRIKHGNAPLQNA